MKTNKEIFLQALVLLDKIQNVITHSDLVGLNNDEVKQLESCLEYRDRLSKMQDADLRIAERLSAPDNTDVSEWNDHKICQILDRPNLPLFKIFGTFDKKDITHLSQFCVSFQYREEEDEIQYGTQYRDIFVEYGTSIDDALLSFKNAYAEIYYEHGIEIWHVKDFHRHSGHYHGNICSYDVID